MPRRYHGAALSAQPLAELRRLPFGLAAAGAGLTAAEVLDPGALDSLTLRAVGAVLLVHGAVIVGLGGWELCKLLALMRRAEPADVVTATPPAGPDHPWQAPASLLALAPIVAGFCVAFDGAAAVIAAGMALGAGSLLAVALPKLLLRRRERRLGRRYFRTSGEPEKLVWLAVGPFADAE